MTTQNISGKTQILGVIGHPVNHTGSPAMQNHMCQQLGLDYVYVAFNVAPDQLESAISGIRALHIKGVNVTIPHKEAVIPFLDELDPLAEKIGAVNTIVNQNGRLIGYNTDGRGFLIALMQELQIDVNNKRIIILGAGGSGKAIAHTIAEKPINSLIIANRTAEKAHQLAQLCQAQGTALSDLTLASLTDADIVINTTALGMGDHQNQCPVTAFSWVSTKHLICDIIYNPSETPFLSQCRQKGATTLNGIGMLAGQGQLAFELFTGFSADYQLLKAQLI